jgi:hypothetical protein
LETPEELSGDLEELFNSSSSSNGSALAPPPPPAAPKKPHFAQFNGSLAFLTWQVGQCRLLCYT